MMRVPLILIWNIFLFLTAIVAPAENLTLEISKGVTYGFETFYYKPGDPYFLGPPVFLSVSQPAVIHSATIWVDMGPIITEQVSSFQDGEFNVAFAQDGQVLKLNIERSSLRVKEGERILQIQHNRFSFGNLGYFFGKFKILLADIRTVYDEPADLELSDGSWQIITDFSLSFKLTLVDKQSQEPLSNFSVSVLGYGDVDNLFNPPLDLPPTDANGNTQVIFTPDPAGLFYEENSCQLPLIDTLDFWLSIQPAKDVNYRSEVIEISVPLQTSCASPFFADVKLGLTPISSVTNYEQY